MKDDLKNCNLLIIEKSGEILEAQKIQEEDGSAPSYVLSGIFTEFGTKNKNGRVYEEIDFLPHVNELQSKVKAKTLLGELDHPQSFDISLKNVSHLIEGLDYDKSNRRVMGKIKLVNTTAGKEAQALIEAGVPLHISSRAAGVVDEQGNVKLKKLFTYDLVADPGFENAQLERVNESFGFANDADIQIFRLDEKQIEREMLKLEGSEETAVTIGQFNQYSQEIISKIEELKEGIDISGGSEEFQTFKENIVAFTEQLAKGINKTFGYVNYLSEEMSKMVDSHNKSILHSDHVVENLNKLTEYTEYVAENVKKGFDYSDYLKENLEKGFGYTEYLKENIEQSVNHNDHIVESVNQMLTYVDYLKDNLQSSIDYQDYSNEQTNKIAAYANNLSEEINKKFGHSKSVTEAKLIKENDDYKTDLTTKLDAILEAAKKQKVDSTREDASAKLVLERKQFKVKDSDTLHFLKSAPEKYKKLWTALTENQRNSILARAEFFDFVTESVITDFWLMIEKEYSGKIDFEKIDVNEELINETGDFAPNNDYMKSVKEGLKKIFG